MLRAAFHSARPALSKLCRPAGMSALSLSAASTSASEVLFSEHGSKRVVTLNRPKALNALNLSMVREIYPKLKMWDDAADVNLVLMKGTGDKAFCAGGDVIAVIKSAKEAQSGGNSTMHKDFFREEYFLNHLIGTLSKPYIAFIDGITMGGGCGLSVNGQFRVATERTLLAMPETALGLFPDVGGSYFLSRLKASLGMFLALTGYRLNGADTFHAGLATHYVESANLPKLEEALLSLQHTDGQAVESLLRSFEPTHLPPFSLLNYVKQIEDNFSASSVEGIVENLKKDGSEWAGKQLKILSKMSPLSLKVTHRQLEHGMRMSYAKVFPMEYRLTQRFVEDHDFHEGCRAILIDKDRNPKWRPARLEEVTPQMLDHYFSPLPASEELKLPDRDFSSKM